MASNGQGSKCSSEAMGEGSGRAGLEDILVQEKQRNKISMFNLLVQQRTIREESQTTGDNDYL